MHASDVHTHPNVHTYFRHEVEGRNFLSRYVYMPVWNKRDGGPRLIPSMDIHPFPGSLIIHLGRKTLTHEQCIALIAKLLSQYLKCGFMDPKIRLYLILSCIIGSLSWPQVMSYKIRGWKSHMLPGP